VVGQLEKALKAVGRVAVLEPERAKQPAAKLGGEDEEAAGARVHARRLPALRPEGDGEEAHEEAGETTDGLHLPKLTDLQERLRDVRVGTPAPVLRVGDAVARARLKQAAKDGQNAELTLAEQLGLKMRRVVIDAGHGGHDTGAIGPTGVQEKDVTLQIALQVAKKLEAAGLEVLLTRDDDTFVRLEDRAQIANTHKGDLFVSIHCNAAPSRTLRGIETYTLNTSADRYSIRLAARENASSERGVSDLQFILADLATKANTEESTRLARRVQKSLVKDLSAEHKGIRDLGTKEALFFVLLGAKMPAILVETSFLSHPDEEKLLGSAEYQTEVAASISDAVTGFLEEREAKLARVD
jgi:N-acetylmuramoyl-L-alanine amidase